MKKIINTSINDCPYCKVYKKNFYGLCENCHRFPNSNDLKEYEKLKLEINNLNQKIIWKKY